MMFSIKGKRFLYMSLIAGGLLAGCTSENPSDGNDGNNVNNGNDGNVVNPPVEVYRMTFNASEGNGQDTRASVDEESLNNEQSNVFRWDAYDRIMVWTGDKTSDFTPCMFTTKEGGLTSAYFEYEGVEVDSYTYFGYYPYEKGLQYNKIDINIPTDGSIVQTEKNSSSHLGAYRPMYTKVIKRSESTSELTGMSFRHLTGLLYFRIRNKSGKDSRIESVTLSCTGKVFSSSAVLNYTPENSGEEPQFSVYDTNQSESVSLSLGHDKQGVTIKNEEIMQAFLPVLPVYNLSGTKLTLILRVDGYDYVSLEVDGNLVKAFDKATYYRFGLTVKQDGIEVEPVIAGWEPGEDIDIPVL